MLDRIADSIQTSVSNTCDLVVIVILMDRCFCDNSIFLFKVAFINTENWFRIDVMVFKDMIYIVWCKFFVSLVGNIFYKISDFFSHLFR